MHIRRVGLGAIAAMMLATALLVGCAGTQQVREPTPEELAARRDSIAKANERELKISRMFAYDKMKAGQWMEARDYLWKVIELDVKDQYNDWDRMYQTYMQTNQPDSAQIILEMGLEHFPEDPFLNSTLGFMLKAQGEKQRSLELYKTALKAEPENTEYMTKIAELHEDLNNPDAAISMYERLLEVTPEDQAAKDRYTYLLRKFRSPEDYIESLEEDVANNPDNADKRMELVIAYSEQGLNEKLLPHVNKFIELEPARLEGYRRKAEALENLNRLQDAINTYKSLLERDADNTEAMLRIADNYRLLNEYVQARNWVLKARDAFGGTSAEADYILGQIYESSGDNCSKGGTLSYDDKLVFVIAHGLFKKAANSNDYLVQEKANRRLQYLEQFVPAKGDWFLNKSKKMPEKDCYSWINASWPEVGYIKTFLSRYED